MALPRPTKTIQFGDVTYLLPFRATGFYVDDARWTTVAECRSMEVAKALAKAMNELANKA